MYKASLHMAAMLESPTRRHWSTADVDPQYALAYWVDTVCKSFLEIDIESPERDFHGWLDQTELGPATLYRVAADTQTVRRTSAWISRSRYDGYFLLHLRAGQLRFQQYGRDSHIEAGDCVLVDCSSPYRLECRPSTRSVALRFSKDWLRNWVPAPESVAGIPLRAGSGWRAALSAALASLDTDRDDTLALPPGVVAEQLAALLALALGPDVQASSVADKLYKRVQRTVRDRCQEPGLTPAAIAAAHGISKRYLHYLFAHSATTFGSELMRLRVELAHRLLSDKRYATLTVSEVAARCGFVEPSHFARRFRRAFGSGPTDFRTSQRHPAD